VNTVDKHVVLELQLIDTNGQRECRDATVESAV